MNQKPTPWLVFGAVVTGQLMIGVDATVLALAIPAMDADLHLSSQAVAWVMAGYVVAAGSLMVAGVRVAQAFGYGRVMTRADHLRRGLSPGRCGRCRLDADLRTGRPGGRGRGHEPAAMARLSAAFPDEGRNKAYGMFGMIMGSGTAIGLMLGGVLTQMRGSGPAVRQRRLCPGGADPFGSRWGQNPAVTVAHARRLARCHSGHRGGSGHPGTHDRESTRPGHSVRNHRFFGAPRIGNLRSTLDCATGPAGPVH